MSLPEGRWVGGWYEWSCVECGAVVTSRDAPKYQAQASCHGCRVGLNLAHAGARVSEMAKALQESQDELRQLRAKVVAYVDLLDVREREIETLTIECGNLRDKLAERAA